MRKLSVLFVLLVNVLQSQDRAAFINHLARQERHREALELLRFEPSRLATDTLAFLKGKMHHYLRSPDSAVFHFSDVPRHSPLFAGARFTGALDLLYSKRYAEVSAYVQPAEDPSGQSAYMETLLIAAGELLQRDYQAFDSVAAQFNMSHFATAPHMKEQLRLRGQMERAHMKSPAVAAGLSALVPGLGKFYAGRRGGALATFMTNLVAGGIAAEMYLRAGPKSAQFISAATIFTIFYTGNIVGSIHSVRLQQRSLNGKFNNAILATVHIPVHSLFMQ